MPPRHTPRPAPLRRLSRLLPLVMALMGLLLIRSSPARAAEVCANAREGEPMKVFLLTTSPGGFLFNSMGHTALSFSGGRLDEPMVFNWGAYDGTRPDLLPAFLSGRMEFWLAGEVWKVQWRRTVKQDRTMVAQELALPPGEAEALLARLEEGYKPENRAYVYHWAKDNCATQARDAVDRATGGAVRAALAGEVPQTARYEGSRHLAPWPVVAWAWRFMAGPYVDLPLTEWDLGMVPERLMHSLDKVRYTRGGVEIPLVTRSCVLREGGHSWAPAEPLRPWPWIAGGAVLAALTAGLGLGGRGRAARVGAGLLIAVHALWAGFLGLATFVFWSISQLDGVGPTENWLFAGPQTLLLVWAGLRLARGRALGPRALQAVRALGALGLLALPARLNPAWALDNTDMIAAFVPPLLAAVAVLHRRGAAP